MVRPRPEVLALLKERRPVSEVYIKQVVVEHPELAEAVECLQEEQMVPPKNLLRLS